MADLNVNSMANAAGTGAVNFPFGATGISGGGGGGGAQWNQVAGIAPEAAEENSEKVYQFVTGQLQKLCLFYRVPTTYNAGQQIFLRALAYINATSTQFKMQLTSYLIRPGTDAVSSVANSLVQAQEQTIVSPANTPYLLTLALTNASGQINAIAVTAGDLIRIELQRVDATSENANDVKFIPSTSEIT